MAEESFSKNNCGKISFSSCSIFLFVYNIQILFDNFALINLDCRMCKSVFIFLVFVLICLHTFAQFIGGVSDEKAFDMISDGTNLYMTGFTKSYGIGNRDGFVVKYQIVDHVISYNTWGKTEYDEFRSIYKAGDNIILGGYSYWRDGVGLASVLTKLDENLQLEWTKPFGNWHYQHAYSTIMLQSGNYLLGGVDRSIGLYGPYIVKTDQQGELIWEYTYEEYMPAHTVDILQKENGNILLLSCQGGFFNPSTIWHMSSHADADVLFIEIDTDGSVVNDTIFQLPYHDIPVKILSAPNDQFYLLWHSQSVNPGNSFDICLSLISENYDFIWTKTYGGEGFEYAADMEIYDESNICIVGTSASSGEEYPTIYYIKTDANGEVLEEEDVYTDYRGYAAGIEIIDTVIYILATVTVEGDDNFVLLKNFELNKKSEFSPDLYVFPNPVTDYCKIVFNSMFFNNSTIQISIYNINGQIVYESEYSIVDSDYVFEIDLSGFRAGQYFIKTENSDFSETTKIIVIK